MFSAIGNFFGKMLGTDKAAGKVVDSITNGIDKIWYTDQEKSEDQAQARREGQQVFMSWFESTSGSRVARRMIAMAVTFIWAAQYFLAMALLAAVPWVDTPSIVEAMKASATSLHTSGEQIDGAMLFVLGYYFFADKSAAAVSAGVEMFKNKRSK